MNNLNKEIENISIWIKEYFAKANKQKAIVGISGGVDSAVTAALCVKALGPENVHGVLLPCSSMMCDMLDAEDLCKQLEIKIHIVDLRSIYRVWIETHESQKTSFSDFTLLQGDSCKLLYGNAKARLRMLELYALSEQLDGLVVGTTNKTESVIGYATKYGDGGVDIEPLMDFYKTEIWEIARQIKIPNSIINKPPSAGLWEGQTDEKELGMSYKRIDAYLQHINEFGKLENPEIEKINKLIKANKHKDLNLPYYKRN